MTSLRELERRKLYADLEADRPALLWRARSLGLNVKDDMEIGRLLDLVYEASVESGRAEAEREAARYGVPTRTLWWKRNVTDIKWDVFQEKRRRELERTYG